MTPRSSPDLGSRATVHVFLAALHEVLLRVYCLIRVGDFDSGRSQRRGGEESKRNRYVDYFCSHSMKDFSNGDAGKENI